MSATPKDKKKESGKKGEKTSFGRSVVALFSRKKKEPSKEEQNKVALDKLREDRSAVARLKEQLLKVSAQVPPVIELALKEDSGQSLEQGQTRVGEALAAKGAVEAYLKAKIAKLRGRDEGGMLSFGSHALVVKFTLGLDQIEALADRRWALAATAAEANTHAQFLAQQIDGAVRKRGEVNTLLANADAEIAKAEKAIGKVSGIGSVDVREAKSKVDNARQLFNSAKDSKDVPLALDALSGWDVRLSEATEGESGSLKKLEDYKKLRKTVFDQIGQASVLRGATEDTPLRALLRSAQIDIELADEAMSKATGPVLIAKAMEILEPHKGLLDRAKKIDAELKQQAKAELEALPKYKDALSALVRAREKMAGMPGAAAIVNQADIALAAAQLGTDGRPPGGYVAALKLLAGKAEELLKTAAGLSQVFSKNQELLFPELAELRRNAELMLGKVLNVSPPAQAGIYQEALATAIGQPKPLEALRTLMSEWQRLVERQREIDKKLFNQRKRMTTLIAEAEQLRAPASVLDGLRNTDGIDRLRDANEYESALALAERATTAAENYLKVAAELNRQWSEAERELNGVINKANRWIAWPPLKAEASSIAGDVRRVLDAVAKGGDLAQALESVRRIKERLDNLEDRAVEQNLDPEVDLTAYGRAIETAQQGWEREARTTRQALAALAEALKQAGVGGSATATAWHTQFADLEKAWAKALERPKLLKDQAPADALVQTLSQFKAEALIIRQGAIAAATDADTLNPLLETAKGQDREKALRAMHAELAELIVALETSGVAVAEFWKGAGRSFDPARAQGLEKTWKLMKPMVETALEKRREELTRLREESLKKADVLDKSLNGLLSRNQVRFPGFFEDLRGRAQDARAMLMTGDPALMAAGQRQIEELAKTIGEARKGGESEGGSGLKTFDDVAEMWKQLSNKVGEDVLMSRLPATYNRLYGELKAATEKSKKLPPDQGWKLLEALRLPIESAVAQAEVVAERYAIFKARQEQLDDKLVELHKLTGTRFTEKTEAFDARFATSMASAKKMAKQEGQMDAAFKLLDQLDRQLSTLIASPGTARTELQKLDSEAAAEQRELRDLARVWESTRGYWSETLLPQVKKAMASRGEEDDNEYGDLKDAVSRAAAPLKGYLGVISSLPHEYLATNPSPDMKAARAAFSSAHARLAQLQKTANRLLNGGGSTSVDLESDLRKLEDEWIRRVERLRGAFGRLADSIRGLPEQAGSDPSQADRYLAPGPLGQLRTAANVLGRSIPEAAARFSASAFSTPLSVLRSRSSLPADRRKAREDALRTMRQLRDELVGSSLFRQLFEGAAAGTLDVDVRPELGLLRASLKKIELAVLVAA